MLGYRSRRQGRWARHRWDAGWVGGPDSREQQPVASGSPGDRVPSSAPVEGPAHSGESIGTPPLRVRRAAIHHAPATAARAPGATAAAPPPARMPPAAPMVRRDLGADPISRRRARPSAVIVAGAGRAVPTDPSAAAHRTQQAAGRRRGRRRAGRGCRIGRTRSARAPSPASAIALQQEGVQHQRGIPGGLRERPQGRHHQQIQLAVTAPVPPTVSRSAVSTIAVAQV